MDKDSLLLNPRTSYGWYNFKITDSIFKNISMKSGVSLVRPCPISIKSIDRYTEIIKHLKPTPEDLYINSDSSQCFDAIYPLYNIGSYRITWNVAKALEIVNRDNNNIVNMLVRQIKEFADYDYINRLHVPNALKNSNPIILAPFEPLSRMIVIDGNHRVFSRDNKGTDDETIDLYALTYEQSLEAMQGDIDRAFYKIHTNIVYIFNFMAGSIDEKALRKALYNLDTATSLSLWSKIKNKITVPKKRCLVDIPGFSKVEFIMDHSRANI